MEEGGHTGEGGGNGEVVIDSVSDFPNLQTTQDITNHSGPAWTLLGSLCVAGDVHEASR